MDKLTLLVQCEDCKKQFKVEEKQFDTITTNSLTHKKEYKVNEQSIFLTYYDCPYCGRRHIVQIDDIATLNKLREVKKQFVKLSIARKSGKSISKKQSDKFRKSRKDLSDYRINLMKQYTGTVLNDEETGKEFELRFSTI